MRRQGLISVLLLAGLSQATPVSPPDEGKENGQFLALTVQKLQQGFKPARPLRIWALGDPSIESLGNGALLRQNLITRFTHCPNIELKTKALENASWTVLNQWITKDVLPDHPDLVILYATGKPHELDSLLTTIRTQSTADILVPSIHWRMMDGGNWGETENAIDQDIAVLRETCRKHGAEFVENRKLWAEHLSEKNLTIDKLLKGERSINENGANLFRKNILAHLRKPGKNFHYNPRTRERRVNVFFKFEPGEPFDLPFTGNRVELVGRRSPEGGNAQVILDGKPLSKLSFSGEKGMVFRSRIATDLTNKRHFLRIVPEEGKAALAIQALEIYEPELKPTEPTVEP
jgi:hypothetical protein